MPTQRTRNTAATRPANRLLGLSRFEFDGFLKERHIYDHAYDVEDLEEDRFALAPAASLCIISIQSMAMA